MTGIPNDDENNDQFYWNYYILLTSMSSENMDEGIEKSLYFTKLFFNADNVIIYKKNEIGDYVHKHNQSLMNSNSSITTAILNSAKTMVEKSSKYEMHPNIDGLKNIAFIPAGTANNKYVIALTGDKELKNLDRIDTFRNTMVTILSRYEQLNRLSKSSEIDILTGLSNRNAFEYDVKTKSLHEGTVYAIFDLFRLKHINDTYSHDKGDEYIKKAAEILKNHFPRYIYTVDQTGKKTKSETGNRLYRIGGDEFVLISDTETYQNALIKIMIIHDEVKNTDLGINEVLGINHGLIESGSEDTFRDLYLKADCLLENNKTANYQALGIERRK